MIDLAGGNDDRLLTSRLSRLDCRVRPIREGNRRLLELYDDLFGAERMQPVELSAAVLDEATDLRAADGFKTPDAIHLATAICEKADAFLTADSSLGRCSKIRVETLSA